MKLDKNGIILIASLWILAILSVLAIGIGFRISIEGRLSKYNVDRTKALYLARAGVVKARQILAKNTTMDYDSIRNCGIDLPDDNDPKHDPDKIFNASLGEGSFHIGYNGYPGMSDEERRININKAPKQVLVNLIDAAIKADEQAAEKMKDVNSGEIANSILRWRGDTSVPADEADEEYYEPYGCKLAPFSVIEELFLVRGVTPEIFYSIKNFVTVYGDGKINMNTASETVLLAVIRSIGMTEDSANIVKKIMELRNRNWIFTESNFIENNLQDQLGLFPQDAALIKNSFTMKSNYFRIESKGVIGKSKVEKVIVCIVKRDAEKGKALRSYREY